MARRPSGSEPLPASERGEEDAPGLREQVGRTRLAFTGMIASHYRLLMAELSEIMGDVKRMLAVVAGAAALLMLAGILLGVGTLLWLGEWVFGSMGWGVLLGSTLLIAIAVAAVLSLLPGTGARLGQAFGISLIVAAIFGMLFWLRLTSRAWGWVGDSFFGGLAWPDGSVISAADRPIVVAALVLAVVSGLIGALIGLASGEGLLDRLSGAFGGALVAAGLVGAPLGALTGVPMSPGISVAVGLAILLVLFPIAALIMALPAVDWDELKERMTPNVTIETTKETIEWVREQMPLGRKS